MHTVNAGVPLDSLLVWFAVSCLHSLFVGVLHWYRQVLKSGELSISKRQTLVFCGATESWKDT